MSIYYSFKDKNLYNVELRYDARNLVKYHLIKLTREENKDIPSQGSLWSFLTDYDLVPIHIVDDRHVGKVWRESLVYLNTTGINVILECDTIEESIKNKIRLNKVL